MPGLEPLSSALVTGASGFIGRALCARLKAKDVRVRALMRHGAEGPWDEVALVDIGADEVPPSLLDGVDTVFHLAGKAHALDEIDDASDAHRRVTVDGTRRLLAACAGRGVARLVFASSVKAMGEGGDRCQSEHDAMPPETAYGRAKLEAEQLIAAFGRDTGAHVVCLRLPLVYGPGGKGNLERMLRAVAADRLPPLPETGNKRSMVHVEDVVSLAMLVCDDPRAALQTFIVTDGRSYSTRELYDLMRSATGKRPVGWSVPRGALRALGKVGDVVGSLSGRRAPFDSDAWRKLSESAWYSAEKAERELGFRASRTLADALPQMVAELRAVLRPGASSSRTPAER